MENHPDRPAGPWWDIPAAIALLTRLPLPALPARAFARPARAVWAYPLAGLAVGLPAGLLGWAALALGLPALLAAGLALTALVMATGALHEDGLADSADGIWGGRDPARRLEIMRDSRIGSYGVLALILSQGLRWGALAALMQGGAWAALPLAAMASRAVLPVVMRALPPARGDGLGRAQGRPGARPCLVALTLGAGPALAILGAAALPGLAAAAALVALWALLARRRLGGQTGDVLGAAQQLAEIALLIGWTATL